MWELQALEIYKDIENGKAKDYETKKKLIELYNTIYDANYKVTTNCGSCLGTIRKAIINIYEKHKK